MMQALEQQIKARTAKEAHGEWVPPWKFPANWLSQKCWEDEVKIELKQESRNEKNIGLKDGSLFSSPDLLYKLLIKLLF
jgi:hypothetical protein